MVTQAHAVGGESGAPARSAPRGSPGRRRPRRRGPDSPRPRRRAATAAANRCPTPAPRRRAGALGGHAERMLHGDEPNRWFVAGGRRGRRARSTPTRAGHSSTFVGVSSVSRRTAAPRARCRRRRPSGPRRPRGRARAAPVSAAVGSGSALRLRLAAPAPRPSTSTGPRRLRLGGARSGSGDSASRRRPPARRTRFGAPRHAAGHRHRQTADDEEPEEHSRGERRLVHPDVAEVAQLAPAGVAQQRHRRGRQHGGDRQLGQRGRQRQRPPRALLPDRDAGGGTDDQQRDPHRARAAASAPPPAPAAPGCRRRTP